MPLQEPGLPVVEGIDLDLVENSYQCLDAGQPLVVRVLSYSLRSAQLRSWRMVRVFGILYCMLYRLANANLCFCIMGGCTAANLRKIRTER
jgi:hypothetical protein